MEDESGEEDLIWIKKKAGRRNEILHIQTKNTIENYSLKLQCKQRLP